MTSAGAAVEARHAFHEANARIALALSILRGSHWCLDCGAAATQADRAECDGPAWCTDRLLDNHIAGADASDLQALMYVALSRLT